MMNHHARVDYRGGEDRVREVGRADDRLHKLSAGEVRPTPAAHALGHVLVSWVNRLPRRRRT